MDFIILFSLTIVLLALSFFKDRKKTAKALKMAGKRLAKMGPSILLLIGLLSLTLYFIPKESVSAYLNGGTRWAAATAGAFFGSILMMPGFIAFPLAGTLRSNGVPWMVVASFTTTLMMVGIVTLPVEKRFLGWKVALIRNAAGFVIALIVALATGLAYGELSL